MHQRGPARQGLAAGRDWFDLHAGVAVRAGARARLERLCRYVLRPPVGQNRLQLMPDRTVVLELPRRWTDGTTHLIFDPVELLERLAALIPRPRVNLVLYYGVLAPRAAWRRAVVPDMPGTTADEASSRGVSERGVGTGPAVRGPIGPGPSSCSGASASATATADSPKRSRAKAVGFDVLACPRCAGRLTLVALIYNPVVIGRSLDHLGLPVERPAFLPARDPPLVFEAAGEDRTWHD